MSGFPKSLRSYLDGDRPLELLEKDIHGARNTQDITEILDELDDAKTGGQLDGDTYARLKLVVDTITEQLDAEASLNELSSKEKDIAPGTILNDRFILDEVIGHGGMGVVFKARDQRKVELQDREPYIGIKVLSRQIQSHPSALIALQRESKKAQKLAHPNIVTVFDFDRDGDRVYMTMEYLEGEPLNRILKRGIGLSKEEALSIIADVAQGLAYAHQKGIVHSDLKPGNIFVTREGTAKILDFGIARAAKLPGHTELHDATLFDPRSLAAHTPAYASCEIVENQPPDPRDDIYALGCVAFELLAGRHPFNRVVATVARDSRIKLQKPNEFNRSQWKAIRHALQFERSKRTESIEQFLSELNILGVQRKATNPTVLVLVSVFTLAVLGGGYSLFRSLDTAGNRSTVEAQDAGIIGQLLGRAETQLENGRVLTPKGGNALHTYTQILKLDPKNADAQAGIKRIKAQSIQRLQRLRKENRIKSVEEETEVLLRLLPNDSEILRIKDETATLQTQESEDKVSALLRTASAQIEKQQYVTPEHDNAFDTYQQILRLDPENSVATSGIEDILHSRIENARSYLQQKEWRKAEAFLEQGQRISPDHQGIQRLLLEMKEAEERALIEEIRGRKITDLLESARTAIQDGRILLPGNSSAVAYCRRVLDIDPENRAAQAILSGLAADYLEVARDHSDQNNWQDALDSIDKAIEVLPQNAEYVRIRQEYRRKQEQQERTEKLLATANRLLEQEAVDQRQIELARSVILNVLELQPESLAAKSLQKRLHRQMSVMAEKARAAEIASALKRARVAMRDGRLLEPDGSNVVAHARHALSLDSENREAAELLNAVASNFFNQAVESAQHSDWNASMDAIQRALLVEPDNDLYRKKLEEIEYGQKTQERVNLLLQDAETLLSSRILDGQLVGRIGELLQAVLEVDPGNERALAAQSSLRQYLLDGIDALRKQENYGSSMALLDAALNVFPLDQALSSVYAVVAAEHQEQQKERKRQVEILRALTTAESLANERNNSFTQIERAMASYESVLELDPTNVRAKRGIESILQRLISRVEQLSAEGDLSSALGQVEQSLQLFPASHELSKLKIEIQRTLGERQVAEKKQKQIENLLDQAGEHFKARRWSLPKNRNALAVYRQVLQLDPGNALAQEGVARVREKYLALGNDHLEQRKLDAAKRSAARGLAEFPDDTKLRALDLLIEHELVQQKAAKHKQRKAVQQLVDKGHRSLAERRIFSPSGDCAYDYYGRALRLEPENEQATQGLQDIRKHLMSQLVAALNADDLSSAERWIGIAVSRYSDDNRITDLVRRIDARAAAKREYRVKDEKINSLLMFARRRVDQGALIPPKRESAYQIYKEILQLSPGNREAQGGLQRLVDLQIDKIREQIESKQLERARISVEEALSIYTGNGRFLELEKRISTLEEEAARKRKPRKLRAIGTF